MKVKKEDIPIQFIQLFEEGPFSWQGSFKCVVQKSSWERRNKSTLIFKLRRRNLKKSYNSKRGIALHSVGKVPSRLLSSRYLRTQKKVSPFI